MPGPYGVAMRLSRVVGGFLRPGEVAAGEAVLQEVGAFFRVGGVVVVVADGVLGTVHRQKALALGAADLVVAAAHLVGNKAVGIAVDEEDRHFAVGRGIGAVSILGVKMAEQDGPQPPDGVGGAEREAG